MAHMSEGGPEAGRGTMTGGDGLPVALVTGAAGFLGAHVTRALLGHKRVRIVALDDLSGGFKDNVPLGVEFVHGSVTDHELLAGLFRRHPIRYVYHLAAYAAEGLSHFIRRFNYTNNLIGSVNLINESVIHDVECFVFTSSIAVYGAMPPPMREDQTPHPEDPYGVAKLAVELDLATARSMFALRSIIFRPHNVYGEYQNLGDPYRNVIGIFMNQIMQGRPMTIFGDGSQQRAFTYVADIASLIAESPWVQAAHNEIINVGADVPCTVQQLAGEVAAAMDSPAHAIEKLPQRNEVQFAYSEHAKAKRIFGPSPDTSLRDGLRRMARWARAAGIRRAKAFEEVEVNRNMPLSWQRIVTGNREAP